jgi:hypothetical protein
VKFLTLKFQPFPYSKRSVPRFTPIILADILPPFPYTCACALHVSFYCCSLFIYYAFQISHNLHKYKHKSEQPINHSRVYATAYANYNSPYKTNMTHSTLDF